MPLSKFQIGLFSCLLLLLAVVYADIFQGLFYDWSNDENYSHGFLVPVISGYFAWQMKDELRELPFRPSNIGLLLVLFALLILFAGVSAQVDFALRTSFVFLLFGIVSLAQYAIAWALAQPAMASMVLGVTKLEQIESAIAAAAVTVPEAILERQDAITAPPYNHGLSFSRV